MPKRRFEPEVLEALVLEYKRYVAETNYPLPATFIAHNPLALRYNLKKGELEQLSEFRDVYELGKTKEESFLVQNAIDNPQRAIASMFLLKQSKHGYTDKMTTDITSGGEKIKFASSVPRPALKGVKQAKRILGHL